MQQTPESLVRLADTGDDARMAVLARERQRHDTVTIRRVDLGACAQEHIRGREIGPVNGPIDTRRTSAASTYFATAVVSEPPSCWKCQRASVGPAGWLLPLPSSADDVAGVAAGQLEPVAASSAVVCCCEITGIDVLEAGGEVAAADAKN